MDWLPGLGPHSHSGSKLFPPERQTSLDTQAMDQKVDEVQFSIVCNDCGNYFWSRSKADSHAALTTHFLYEEDMSRSSPPAVQELPTASLESPDTLAKASPEIDALDLEASEDVGVEEYPIGFDCSGFFGCGAAANKHAKIGCMQNTEMVPSGVPDGSPTSAVFISAVTPTSPAAGSSVRTKSSYVKTEPGYSFLPTNGRVNPTSLRSNTKKSTTRANILEFPVYDRELDPTATFGTTDSTSGHVIDSPPTQVFDVSVPNVSQ